MEKVMKNKNKTIAQIREENYEKGRGGRKGDEKQEKQF
jgi:hypothetical protein